jgi:hypothetical protein
MVVRNRGIRSVTFILQIIAIVAFFIPPLIFGSTVANFWLVVGVLHTLIFCAVFFRDSRKRTALSIILAIFVIIWCLIFGLVGTFAYFALAPGLGIDVSVSLFVYVISSFFAMIFALSAPRKYDRMTQDSQLIYPGMSSKYNQ